MNLQNAVEPVNRISTKARQIWFRVESWSSPKCNCLYYSVTFPDLDSCTLLTIMFTNISSVHCFLKIREYTLIKFNSLYRINYWLPQRLYMQFTVHPLPSPVLSILGFNSALLTNLPLKCFSVKRLHEWSFTSAPSRLYLHGIHWDSFTLTVTCIQLCQHNTGIGTQMKVVFKNCEIRVYKFENINPSVRWRWYILMVGFDRPRTSSSDCT